MSITYRREIVKQSYEEEDFYGNITIRTEEETEILRNLMSPEILENIEGLTGGYGSHTVRQNVTAVIIMIAALSPIIPIKRQVCTQGQ